MRNLVSGLRLILWTNSADLYVYDSVSGLVGVNRELPAENRGRTLESGLLGGREFPSRRTVDFPRGIEEEHLSTGVDTWISVDSIWLAATVSLELPRGANEAHCGQNQWCGTP